MTPRPIHEVPIKFLADSCHTLLAPYHFPCLTPQICFNDPIESSSGIVIPDFHITLEPDYQAIKFPIPLWIAECSFSQTRAGMQHKLEKAAAMFPQIDTALMVSIREASSGRLPKADDPLFSHPELPRTAFAPASLPHASALHPIVVENIVWINVRSVTVYVFLRGEDGKFDFTDGNPLSPFYCPTIAYTDSTI